MTRVLILGATGNIASLTAAELARRGDLKLRLTSRREDGLQRLRAEHPGAEIVQADWTDHASLQAAFADVDRALVITPDFTTDERVVTPNIVAAAQATPGFQHLVRLIALQEGLEPGDMTPAWLATQAGSALHWVAKPFLDASGLPITYVNVSAWITFNLPWFVAEDVKRRRQLPLYADAERPWVTEQDLGEVFARILREGPAPHVGREYVLTGPERFRFREVAALLSEEVGETVTWVDTPEAVRRAVGEHADILQTYLDHESRHWNKVQVTRTLEGLLGRPATTLRQYIAANRDLFA